MAVSMWLPPAFRFTTHLWKGMRVASSLFGCGIVAVLWGLHTASAVDEKFAPVWPQKGYDATHHARSPFHGPHASPRVDTNWTSPTGQAFSDYPGERNSPSIRPLVC